MKECPGCHRCFPDHVNHCPSDGDLLKFTIQGTTVLDERYQLEKRLGQGGMGIVFKARHVFLKTHHAVKVILPDLVGNDPSLVTRFRQEAMAAAAIRHQNTVNVTDYGVIGGTTPFLVMEFIEGRSLHDILAQQKRLSPAQAVEITLAVCAGVAAAHRQGIVHRDLKPLNILLQSGRPPAEGVKVLDFGLAKIKSGELLGSFVAAQTQGMMGSPFYMAPEQWGDDDVDVRADIYSLGVILYQMIAGDVPFRGVSIPSIMKKHLSDPPMPLSERGVEVPPEVERAVQHALEKEPEKRPQTVEEFMEELRRAQCSVTTVEADTGDGLGVQTIPLGTGETMGAHDPRGVTTGAQAQAPSGFETVADVRADIAAPNGTLEEEAGPDALSRATVAYIPDQSTDELAGGARREPGMDTARNQAGQTIAQLEGPGGDALTARLPDMEEQRRGEEEETLVAAAAEQRRRAQEQEREELERREAEERQRREAKERAAAAAATAAQARLGKGAGAQQAAQMRPAGATANTGAAAATTSSRAPLIALGALVLLGVLTGLGGLGFYLWKRGGDSNVNAGGNVNVAGPANVNAEATPTPAQGGGPTRPDLVALPGGTFRMGHDDVPEITEELKRERAAYLLWVYNHWPSREVSVKPFAIDRTEVTNAEYAEFVRTTGHKPPPAIWEGNSPRAGEERLPVRNVTFEDARKFAEWRSKRDGVTYRLPTEEEWEYAARGGDSSRSYPWGGAWADGRANFSASAPREVGSFPEGRTPQGVEDMLGNVWEWTGSAAAMYKGNDRTELPAADRGKIVVRGGSYQSRHDGDEPVNALSRRWVARDLRDPVLGFRLVRVGR